MHGRLMTLAAQICFSRAARTEACSGSVYSQQPPLLYLQYLRDILCPANGSEKLANGIDATMMLQPGDNLPGTDEKMKRRSSIRT